MIVDQPVHRLVPEVVVPGILRSYDTGILLRAVAPRPVAIVSPRDAMGDPVSEAAYRNAVGPAGRRVRFESRGLAAVLE